MLGFLSGSAAAGAAVYYYILSEYRTANEMLSEDIYVCLVLSLRPLGFEDRRLTGVFSISTGSSISHATAPNIHFGARDQDGFGAEKEMTRV